MTPIILFVPLFLPAAPAGHQGQLAAEFSLQGQRIAAACPPLPSSLATCPIEFLTDHPIHLAAGSLAPQNGFAFGPAFVTHRTASPDISWSADGVARPVGVASRPVFQDGFDARGRHDDVPITSSAAARRPTSSSTRTRSSMRTCRRRRCGRCFSTGSGRIPRAGPGGVRHAGDRRGHTASIRCSRHAIRSLNLSAIGEVNGRFVDLSSDPKPFRRLPGLRLYDEQTAPGLSTQPGVVQFGEGVRMKPVVLNNRLQFNYAFVPPQFVAASDSHYSFQRWTADSTTILVLPDGDRPGVARYPRPERLFDDAGSSPCPTPSLSRNRYGSVGFQVYASRSWAGRSGAVPFYFQQTLGGSDIDGERRLSAYEDYRFRGPGVFLLREHLEHYIYGVVGATVEAEQGRSPRPAPR